MKSLVTRAQSLLRPAASLGVLSVLVSLGGCAAQSAADGTPPVSSRAVPGAPGLPNPSATDPSPRGYGPASTSSSTGAEFRR